MPLQKDLDVLVQQRETLTRQRDDLLAACKEAVTRGILDAGMMKLLVAAIAKAQESKQSVR